MLNGILGPFSVFINQLSLHFIHIEAMTSSRQWYAPQLTDVSALCSALQKQMCWSKNDCLHLPKAFLPIYTLSHFLATSTASFVSLLHLFFVAVVARVTSCSEVQSLKLPGVALILSECCGRCVASNWLFAVAHLLCCSVAVRAQRGANNDCVTFIIECLACRGRFGLHFKHFVNI